MRKDIIMTSNTIDAQLNFTVLFFFIFHHNYSFILHSYQLKIMSFDQKQTTYFLQVQSCVINSALYLKEISQFVPSENSWNCLFIHHIDS